LVKALYTQSSSGRGRRSSLRTALVAGVAVSALLSLSQSADARRLRYYGGWYGAPVQYQYPMHRVRHISSGRYENSESRREPKKEIGFGDMPQGPLQIVVNMGAQKVTLYSNGVRVAQGAVSTGVPGHPTPTGVFSIIEKDRYHHSNLYSGAPMPFMQRITWSGVALHEGVVPGHPASHGCIRMVHDFAQKLWPITKLGVRVLVVRNDVVPHDFEHAKLFAPRAKPAEPPMAMIGPTDGRGGSHAVVLAQAEQAGGTEQVPETRSVPATIEEEPKTAAAAKTESIELGKSTEEIKGREGATSEQVTEIPTATTSPELRKSVEVPSEPAEKTTEVTSTPVAPAPAQASSTEESVKPAPTEDPPRPITPRSKSAEQPVKRIGQVAIFVSRKEKKIFIRQGFIPVLEMPISIEEPDRPLGTHVFTAMGPQENGSGMRWNLMTIPTDGSTWEPGQRRRGYREPPRIIPSTKPPSGAAEALERIEFPKEALDRITELLIPGSSLVISDEGLGRETGRGTEFIVLTH
jgi:hypothetical protein